LTIVIVYINDKDGLNTNDSFSQVYAPYWIICLWWSERFCIVETKRTRSL